VKKLLLILLFLVFGLAGVAYWISSSRNGSARDDAYTLVPVEFGSLVETVSASATLKLHEVVLVSSDLPGKVVEIYPGADFNQIVQEGDPLVKLDDRMAQRKLEQARVAVRLAQAMLANAEAARDAAQTGVAVQRKLIKKELGSEAELEKAEAQLKTAEAAVEVACVRVEEAQEAERQAQLGVELTIIRVPTLSGCSAVKRPLLILDRKVEIGQQVGPAAPVPLFTLAGDLAQMRVHVQVAEADISKVRVGQKAEFTVSAYSDHDGVFKGEVIDYRRLPITVHGAVFYEAILQVEYERDRPKTGSDPRHAKASDPVFGPLTNDGHLRPGMTASVEIIRQKRANVWKVPTAALSFQLEVAYQTEEAKAKLTRWQGRGDREYWKPVWILNGNKKPWPIFVRVSGKNTHGIKDAQFHEVLEWDPELETRPDPQVPSSYPRVIIGAPPASKGGLFNPPSIKF
jgi:HlyD family secretion protein